MKHLFLRILKQIRNDKRSLALIFIAPLLVLTLLYLLLGDSNYKPTISVVNFQEQMVVKLEEQDAKVKVISNDINIDEYLKDKEADAVVSFNKGSLVIKMLENDTVKSSLVLNKVKKALMPAGNDLKMEYVYNSSGSNMFTSLAYVLLGFVSFFFVFLFSGISFIREKNYSTMERMLMTPIKRWEVIAGYTLSFGLIGALQSVVIISFASYVLGVPLEGSIIYAFLIMIMMALTAVTIGSFVSIFSNNEFQIMQFIPIVIIPQIFFSGIIPLDTIPYGLGNLAYIMPIYYGCDGLNEILVKGGGIGDITYNLIALFIMMGVFAVINILVLKKYRRI